MFRHVASLLPSFKGLSLDSTLGQAYEQLYTKYPRRLLYPVVGWAGVCYYFLWNPYEDKHVKQEQLKRMQYLESLQYKDTDQ
ncbi:hypothetical protein EDD86DRAFT_204619 [Gorgonomyces haynaldii]|nr:hypothetical protein EDD86DRAFT_204619 [Gorgonomyces haynaldii]